MICSSAPWRRPATVFLPVTMSTQHLLEDVAPSRRPPTSRRFGMNQLFLAACAVASLPLTAAALSSSAVALGSAPLASSASCWAGVGEDLHPLRGQRRRSCSWRSTPTTEPPRKDGMALSGGEARHRDGGHLALDLGVHLRRVGVVRVLAAAPGPRRASQPLPSIMPVWPCAKIAAWSFSSLVGSPLEYFLARSAHLVRPSCAAGSDSVPCPLVAVLLGDLRRRCRTPRPSRRTSTCPACRRPGTWRCGRSSSCSASAAASRSS